MVVAIKNDLWFNIHVESVRSHSNIPWFDNPSVGFSGIIPFDVCNCKSGCPCWCIIISKLNSTGDVWEILVSHNETESLVWNKSVSLQWIDERVGAVGWVRLESNKPLDIIKTRFRGHTKETDLLHTVLSSIKDANLILNDNTSSTCSTRVLNNKSDISYLDGHLLEARNALSCWIDRVVHMLITPIALFCRNDNPVWISIYDHCSVRCLTSKLKL